MNAPIELNDFLTLPTTRAAALVRDRGPVVAVFPINGTRRWYLLEHAGRGTGDPIADYMGVASRNHVELYRLFFDHGIDTLLTPAFGPDLLQRGEEYVQRVGAAGLARLADDPLFLEFYDAYQVRVRFYGDHRRHLAGTPLAHLSDLFDQVAERTRGHARFRLFFGAFAHDATDTIAALAVEHYARHGRAPSKQELVAGYYGEAVPPVSLFIGFDRFSVFDYPLLATGEEDLYFSVAPSPYLSAEQLRRILYDHLYTRRSPEPEYADLPPEALAGLREFYRANRGTILGLGTLEHGVWLPILEKGVDAC